MDTTDRDFVESELIRILHEAKDEKSYLSNEEIAKAIMLALEKEDAEDLADLLTVNTF